MITLKTNLRAVYAHPVGRDIVDRLLLQLGKPAWLIDNPLVGGLTLGAVKRIAGKRVGPGFFDAVLALLNSEPDRPSETPVQGEPA